MSLTPSTPTGTSPDDASLSGTADHASPFSLQVIRGFALLGMLLISIWEFGGFTSNEQTFFRTVPHGGNYKLMSAISILLEGKMKALLALAFGAGILLFLQKKEQAAISKADAYIRGMIWLMALGVFTAFILLWPGDILFPFGVMGILLFAFTRMKARGFYIAAIFCMLIYCGKQYWNYSDDRKVYKKYTAVLEVEKKFKADSAARASRDSVIKISGDTIPPNDALSKNKRGDSLAKKNDTLTNKQAEEKGAWEGMIKGFKYDSSATASVNKMMRDKWNKVAYKLMSRSQQKESAWLYKTGIWEIGSMMFLGMALLAAGFFSSRVSSSNYLVFAITSIVLGLALGWFRVHYNSLRMADYGHYIDKNAIPYNQFFPLERMILAFGYTAGICWLLRMQWKIFSWLWKGLAAAGEMALSNYILQTILCTFFFNGYGFGYFGRLQQWELYFFVAEVTLVQVVFSVLWLRSYTMGPVEWLLSCLVYRKILPLKKRATTNLSL